MPRAHGSRSREGLTDPNEHDEAGVELGAGGALRAAALAARRARFTRRARLDCPGRQPARAPAAVELGILSPAVRLFAVTRRLPRCPARRMAVDGTECGPPHRPPRPASAAAAGRAFRRAFAG